MSHCEQNHHSQDGVYRSLIVVSQEDAGAIYVPATPRKARVGSVQN